MKKSAEREEMRIDDFSTWIQEAKVATYKYSIDIHNILCHSEDKDGNKGYFLELWSLATRSIMEALDKVRGWKGREWYEEYECTIIDETKSDNPDNLYQEYLKRLDGFCDKAITSWKVPILGFSFIWSYGLLPRISKVIKALKAKYDKLICIIWWSDFNSLPEEDFLKKIFGYWIDIINIWWASEFVDFFWKLSDDDVFYRDSEWLLHIRTEKVFPQNLIFEHQKNNIWNIEPWKRIETTSYYNKPEKTLHFLIRNSHCLNNCRYCVNYLHKTTPLKDDDIDISIDDCNTYLSLIEDEEILLRVDNPNPLQYIDKFTRFLMALNLSKVKNLWFFGDFMWMGNPKIYEKTVKLYDDLLLKWPNINIWIRYWIDAMHSENDWEFLWRTLWLNVAQEEKYIAWFERLDDFYNRYMDNPRIRRELNIIFHPNMQLVDYLERLDFIFKYKKTFIWIFPLVAHFNTKIEKDHKGYNIPEYEVAELISEKMPELMVNSWGHFYLNSRFLDCFMFLANIWYDSSFIKFLVDIKYDPEILKMDNDIFSFFMVWHYERTVKLLEKSNTISWISKTKKKKLLKEAEKFIDVSLNYIDFMIYRENYIARINPAYKTEKFDKLLKELKEIKKMIEKMKKSFKKYLEF
ncbi:MAG: hypothetical protein ACD_3C00177G0002 [uncultured bacterium (gcode 4)]|uniref:Radical SAM protein n=1 Tax=uncultured bacterium (gcode 4) TaxID=1234023 RepID=K2GWH7_9BACT|nr:MAG: hypothetical protein ACD_3C00177G0002 [uncultured bacterium (gcode 4)]